MRRAARGAITTTIAPLLLVMSCVGGTFRSKTTREASPAQPDGRATVGALAEPGVLADGAPRSAIPVETDDPRWGATLAPVTLVAFMDFECPFCARVHGTIVELTRHYGPDKLRVVYKHNPLNIHPRALAAAKAAQAVFQLGDAQTFLAYGERLFERRGSLSDDNLERWAVERGIQAGAFSATVAAARLEAQVVRDMELAATLGAHATPVVFINGVEIVGAQPVQMFQSIVDAELDATQELLKRGISPAKAYAERVTTNYAASRAAREQATFESLAQRTLTAADLEPTSANPTRGPREAPVVIQVFADFQCSYCGRSAKTLRELERRYPGKLRIVWRHLPLAFHARARLAARAAVEAHAQQGSRGFWQMHDLIFDSQEKFGRIRIDKSSLEGYARTLGLDIGRFRQALDDDRHDTVIDRDLAVARAQSITGTPSFVVNRYLVVGARPADELASVIDRALAETTKR